MSEQTPCFRQIFFELFEALAVLDQLAQEPAMHWRHSGCYAYEFFVAQQGLNELGSLYLDKPRSSPARHFLGAG